eukprot:TRINITY_DN575_c0_g2_i1.p2 TRINITY_DN575_c0_g2~~TRINITY_DN575_c0_g2_i1.p2  ORF type:complete len:226 (+),score=50.89 TRINITY_DN575_c0_g2_i1:61-738(+)
MTDLYSADARQELIDKLFKHIDPTNSKYIKHSTVKVKSLKKPNVTIWSKGTKSGDWKVYRVNGEINAKFETVVKFFQAADGDLKKMKIMAQTATSNQIVKKHEHGVHIKRVDAFPWPFADRVFTSYRVAQKTDDKFVMACIHDPNFKPSYDSAQQKAKLFPGGVIIEKINESTTRVTTIGGADLKGNIPAWLVDNFIGDIAHSLGRIQDYMDKKKAKAAKKTSSA